MDLAEEKPLKLRLLGVRISGFEEECAQGQSTSSQPTIQGFLTASKQHKTRP